MSGPDESTADFGTKLTVAVVIAGSSSETKESASSVGTVFSFEHVPSHSFASTTKEVVDRWEKWGLSARRSMLLFRFKGSSFTASEAAAFLLDFFNDATVRGQLAITANERAAPSPLSGRVGAVQFEQLRTSVTSMSFFDRLADANIVVAVPGEGGEPAGADRDTEAADGPLYIRKQLEEVIEGVPVGDRLRDAVVNPDSENAGLFDESTEQRELLFRIFKHVVVGGSVCQYEVRLLDTATAAAAVHCILEFCERTCFCSCLARCAMLPSLAVPVPLPTAGRCAPVPQRCPRPLQRPGHSGQRSFNRQGRRAELRLQHQGARCCAQPSCRWRCCCCWGWGC